MASMIRLGRKTPAEIAAVAVYLLCAPGSDDISGRTLFYAGVF